MTASALRHPKPVVDVHASWRAPTPARLALVNRLRAQGVKDEAVLSAIASIPRERFIDPALASRAYDDTALPIGMEQTISQPYVVARMLELLRAGKTLGTVLEIGTGCGYQAAVMSRIASLVHTIERIRPLHEKAKANLRHLRLNNVHLLYGDGLCAPAPKEPYDGIVLAAAGLANDALKAQVKVGGRIVMPERQRDGRQVLKVFERRVAGFIEKTYEEVKFVPLLAGVVAA